MGWVIRIIFDPNTRQWGGGGVYGVGDPWITFGSFLDHFRPFCSGSFLDHFRPFCSLYFLHLPAQPIRFRDNLEGLKFEGQDIHTLQQSFEGMYNLDLQVEGEGDEWDSLQCHMRLHRPQGVQQISLTLADKSRKFVNDHQRLYRYPDRHCAKALRTLRSLVPSQAKWATYFRVTPCDLQHNIEVVKREMVRKGYAHSRWKPQLARHLSKWGVEEPVLHASGL